MNQKLTTPMEEDYVLDLFLLLISRSIGLSCATAHLQIVMALLLAGCATATAVGYIGKYGEIHSRWMLICEHVSKFCQKVKNSVMLSCFTMIFCHKESQGYSIIGIIVREKFESILCKYYNNVLMQFLCNIMTCE